MSQQRRVAIVGDAGHYVGPELARHLAARGHDLVLGDPDPALVEELEGTGAAVEAVAGVRNLVKPESAPTLVAAALARFGRVDSAVAFSGQIVTGRFTKSSLEDLRTVMSGCLEGPYHFLKAAVAPMIEQGDGQVLLITSAAGARPDAGRAALLGCARRGHDARRQRGGRGGAQRRAGEHGRHELHGLPGVPRAHRVPPILRSRAKLEAQVPLGRLGTMEEFAAFCMPFVDGTSRFTTGQFVAYAGGWA